MLNLLILDVVIVQQRTTYVYGSTLLINLPYVFVLSDTITSTWECNVCNVCVTCFFLTVINEINNRFIISRHNKSERLLKTISKELRDRRPRSL